VDYSSHTENSALRDRCHWSCIISNRFQFILPHTGTTLPTRGLSIPHRLYYPPPTPLPPFYMSDLRSQLARLGLSQYLEAFITEGFDTWETVLDITESDL
jgi:hypothetical protein